MYKHASATALALILCLLGGCSGADTHESLGAESIDVLEDFAKVLEDVEDVASARAAAPRLEKIAERMQDLSERRKALGEPTQEQQNAFEEKYAEEMEAAGMALFKEIERISELDEAVNAELDRVMNELQNDMMGTP